MSKRNREIMRVIIPDSHGAHIDQGAESVFLSDLARIAPDEIVMMGDHVDCGGVFSAHARAYTDELVESYEDDCSAANRFLDAIQKTAPNATIHYIEGNHEQRIERWACKHLASQSDAERVVRALGPEGMLELQRRGVRYYRRSKQYMGLSIPGAIKLGRCFFVHGVSHAKHAAAAHLSRFGANVVHGHTHRAQSTVERTVTSDGHGAWSFGTLAKLQPLYAHTHPTSWSHGYGVQAVAPSGAFVTLHAPILRGRSILAESGLL